MKSAKATRTPSAPPSGIVHLGLDRVRPPVDARDHRGLDVLDVAGEREAGLGRHRRQHAEEHREAGEQRQHAVALGLLPEELFELAELLGVLGREVMGLAEVVGQVVELPLVLLRVPRAARDRTA